MPLAFRNVNADPSDPVTSWPTEAVHTALERGDLEHWQRLAAEISRCPWGTTARQVEEVLSHSRPYGVAELMESVIAHARTRAEDDERRTIAAEIRQAIADSGLTRAEFAARHFSLAAVDLRHRQGHTFGDVHATDQKAARRPSASASRVI